MSTKHYRTDNANIAVVEGVRWLVYDNTAGVTRAVFSTDNADLQKEISKAKGVHAISEEEYNKLLNHTALTERLEKEQAQLEKAEAKPESKAEAKEQLQENAKQFADRTPLEQAQAAAEPDKK